MKRVNKWFAAAMAGAAAFLLVSEAGAFGGFGRFRKFQKFNKAKRKYDKTRRRINQVKKLERMFGNLKHGLKGIAPELKRQLYKKKKIARLMDNTLKVQKAFRTGMVDELPVGGKTKLIKKLMRSRKMVSALRKNDFQTLFTEANVKMPPAVAAFVSGKASLTDAIAGVAMSKYAGGASDEFVGGLNIGSAMGALLNKNKKFGGIFQEAMEQSDGKFKNMFSSLSGLAKRRFIMKAGRKSGIMEKLQGKEYGAAFQALGIKIPAALMGDQGAAGEEGAEGDAGAGGEAYDDTGAAAGDDGSADPGSAEGGYDEGAAGEGDAGAGEGGYDEGSTDAGGDEGEGGYDEGATDEGGEGGYDDGPGNAGKGHAYGHDK